MEDEPKTDPADIRLDNAARMRTERTSDTMDLRDRYWQRVLINEVVRNERDWEAVKTEMAHLYDAERLTNVQSIAGIPVI